jgi:hypothetical protein
VEDERKFRKRLALLSVTLLHTLYLLNKSGTIGQGPLVHAVPYNTVHMCVHVRNRLSDRERSILR